MTSKFDLYCLGMYYHALKVRFRSLGGSWDLKEVILGSFKNYLHKIFVGFLFQMKTLKFAFENNGPLVC